MGNKFPEYKQLDLAGINEEIMETWEKENTFEESIISRNDKPEYIFFEGPPSANGKPGIHHVMARAIKDIFCRYKTMTGYKVNRKAGWDTHGLPVELSVEQTLGITKEDIGKKISVDEYNNTCRKEVMKYTDMWEELTRKMGYWVDMDNPYITYDNRYIETLWYLLKNIFNKGLLYKGYTIQPFSPAAGTGLSTHELNQPGCYRDVKDTVCTAMFKLQKSEKFEKIFNDIKTPIYILAWTTTPWTLPSNTALAVGSEIEYLLIETFNPYLGNKVNVVLCKDRLTEYFDTENEQNKLLEYEIGNKNLPYKIIKSFKGDSLVGLNYEQLINWVKPDGEAFRIIAGDFVTTEDGTGIVHIAPTFGADDLRVAKQAGIAALVLTDVAGQTVPLVDKKGRFIPIENIDKDFAQKNLNFDEYRDFESRYVKNEYDETLTEKDITVDIDIAVNLKQNGKAFKIEKHEHNYPHCWRTDKPILYYPLDSWFIRTTAVKDRMIELNETINWKPASTGEGRFGKWLENLVDWNLSRSRYWGTPLPIWRTDDGSEVKCIGSVEELINEIEKSIAAGKMKDNPYKDFELGNNSKENYEKIDLHRPYVDNIILVSESGEAMYRELDLIDVWFDSGAMPYAQWHYPFENKDKFAKLFPADFIAEGVDQTRGWFFTLHAIATMISDSVSFKNIISNGLVLDKFGNKMSKRLGNAVDPFEVISKYGSDALRWYMITNAQPWDNLKFDIAGVEEIQRKFFGTLYNTYGFFALYANVDRFDYSEQDIPVSERPELDQWIISLLNTLIKDTRKFYEDYEPTKAGRAIQEFVNDNLSNWYVRLGRKRYWGGEMNTDKIAAYQTLYTCLNTVCKLASPIAPFITDKIFRDLNSVCRKEDAKSVHLSVFPEYIEEFIDKDLEERMQLAQTISSLVLALRRQVNIKVRQPLQKIIVPVIDKNFVKQVEAVKHIILAETNIKELNLLEDTTGILVKKVKPDFKKLGPRYGKMMKQLAAYLNNLGQSEIAKLENEGFLQFDIDGQQVKIATSDVEIRSEDIPGWLVANHDNITVALDVTVAEELMREGIARELVNRIQNLRKESGFEVTDKINIYLESNKEINPAVTEYQDYICEQTLGEQIKILEKLEQNNLKNVEVNNLSISIAVEKI
jgi:isoleucyl-tRNA synthetase